jgi:hypothetical protein
MVTAFGESLLTPGWESTVRKVLLFAAYPLKPHPGWVL